MECPKSCDTFVCLPPLTDDNTVIFGKNSDRPCDEVQDIVYIPAACYSGNNHKVKCTYIEIDQVPETLAVILSKPNWMWGAEMGSNSSGVCIGNEAVWGKVEPEEEKKLLGMDLVRLGLERGRSAREALDVITTLLDVHGQGGPCSNTNDLTYHNSFLIADPNEAWILETVGKYWAAERIQEGYRNISNGLTIGSQVDLMSPSLKSEAELHFGWNPSTEFNFASIFGYGESCGRFRQGRELLRQNSADQKLDAKRMMNILRNKEINMGGYGGGFATTSSQVSVLRNSGLCVHWFTGTANSGYSIFKPFVFGSLTSIASTKFTESKAATGKHELYRIHEGLYNQIRKEGEIQEKMNELEQNFFNQENTFTAKSDIFKEAVEAEIGIYAKY